MPKSCRTDQVCGRSTMRFPRQIAIDIPYFSMSATFRNISGSFTKRVQTSIMSFLMSIRLSTRKYQIDANRADFCKT